MLSRKKRRRQLRLEKKLKKANHSRRFNMAALLEDEQLARSRDEPKHQKKKEKNTKSKKKFIKSAAVDKEEKELKKLEKNLSLKGKQKLPQSFVRDGLDYILNFTSEVGNDDTDNAENDYANGSDGDGSDGDGSDGDGSDGDGSDGDGDGNVMFDEKQLSDEDISQYTDPMNDDDGEASGDVDSNNDDENVMETHSSTTATATTTTTKKRVRFSLLPNSGGKDLHKTVRGLMNKLNESNIQSIFNEFDELYRQNSRNTLNEILSEILLKCGIQPILISDKLSMTIIMLVALLHNSVGCEVGYSVAVGLVKALNDYLSNPPDYSKGKECDCVLLLLSQMYNFKMIHCVLVYDIIRKLLTELTERDLDLVILILRSCGMEIRRNDSSSLKDIICDINTKALKVESTSRVRYMLEVVGAIKNNNIRKIPKFDPTLLEHMKKVMRGLAKGSLSDSSQLRLTYDELLKSDSKGQMLSLSDSKVTSLHTRTSGGSNIETSILDLARKQRMNTDIRRTVFAVIISSEDFIDAFEKLIALKLSNIQERDIIYVTITCCLQEKSFNPFYAFLCQKLLEYKKDHQITFQYCLWDHLKVLDTLPSFQAGNLQKLIVHLLKRRAVSLSILKVVNFAVLVGTEKLFYQMLLQSFISGLSPYQFKNVMSNLNKDMKKELCWFIKDNVLTTDNDELHLVIENLLEENFE